MQSAARNIWVPTGVRSGAKFKGIFDVRCLAPIEDKERIEWALKREGLEIDRLANTARMLKESEGPVPVSWIKNSLRLDRFDPEKFAELQSLISEKWRAVAENLVVNVGLQHILDVVFSGSSQETTWYVGLTAADPSPAAGDTMASHGGWTEFTDYDEAARQEWVEVRSGQSMDNSASKASFTISQDSSSIGGAFLNPDASGTAGTLMCCAAFTGGNKAADDDDTLEVQYTFSAADDGA